MCGSKHHGVDEQGSNQASGSYELQGVEATEVSDGNPHLQQCLCELLGVTADVMEMQLHLYLIWV